jgi:hypothetical protein
VKLALAIFSLSVFAGCAAHRPAVVLPPPSPLPKAVTTWWLARRDYLDQLTMESALAGHGLVDADEIAMTEDWRLDYLEIRVIPAAALAQPLCDPGQWKDWAAQQDAVERTWKDNAKIVAVPQGVEER